MRFLHHRMLRSVSVAGGGGGEPPQIGWELESAAYDSIEFGLTGGDIYISGMEMSDDGSKLFVSGDTEVKQYTVSPAGDITSPTFINSTTFGGTLVLIRGIFIRNDGMKFYIMDNRTIRQYTLSVANDLASFSDDGLAFNVESITGAFSFPSFTISADGSKLLLINGGTVYSCTISDTEDISSAVYDGVPFDISALQTSAGAIQVKPSGTRFFVLGKSPAMVHQFDFSTPLDLNTASYNSISFSDAAWGVSPEGMAFKGDGVKMYIGSDSGSGDTVRQYTTE